MNTETYISGSYVASSYSYRYVIISFLPGTVLSSKNCAIDVSFSLLLLDILKLEYKGLEGSICLHFICNLGGYSKRSSRSFISLTVKSRNIRQYSKSQR